MATKLGFWALFIVFALYRSAADESCSASQPREQEKMKLIVDVDVGPDDAAALFYLLRIIKNGEAEGNPNTPELLAITCVNGNTLVNNVCKNVLLVLQAVDRLDIPVYKGAERCILTTPDNGDYFGLDGFGDVNWPNPPSVDLIKPKHAVNAMVDLVNENPGEVTLLTLGPLTNVALAIRMDPTFMTKVRRVFIMGGTAEGKGNMIPGVEFNFYMDPEANYVVLNDTKYRENQLTIFPWEPCLLLGIKTKWRKEVFGALTSPEIDMLNKVERIDEMEDDKDWYPADLTAMATLFDESLITYSESHAVEAITQGPQRGGLLVDSTDLRTSAMKVNLIHRIDREKFEELILYHFA